MMGHEMHGWMDNEEGEDGETSSEDDAMNGYVATTTELSYDDDSL